MNHWIRYDTADGKCITPCPFTGKLIGSLFCQLRCSAHAGQSYNAEFVQCRAAALADDKLDLEINDKR